jgi:hypothetical protein
MREAEKEHGQADREDDDQAYDASVSGAVHALSSGSDGNVYEQSSHFQAPMSRRHNTIE